LLSLTSSRVLVGLLDLLLAATMYRLFLLLQGVPPARHFWWTPQSVLSAAIAAAILVLLRSVFEIISIRSVVEYVQQRYASLVLRLTSGYTEMRWTRFVDCNRAELLNTIVNSAREGSFFYHLAIESVAALIVVAIMTGALVYESPLAALGVFLTASAFYGIHVLLLQQRLRDAAVQRENASSLLQKVLAELFLCSKEIRTYSNQSFFYGRVRNHAHSVARETLRLMVFPQVGKIFSDQGVVLVFLGVVAVLELQRGDTHRTLSILVFYFVLSRRMLPLISQISYMASQIEAAFASLRTVERELSICSAHQTHAWQPVAPPAGFVMELENVSFGFERTPAVLRNVYLRQRKGEIVLIRGISGTGKSSLLNLIAGVMQPTSGIVRVDRGALAYVPQETAVLDGSIRDNLLFGLDQKSDAELMDALKMAKLDEFVRAQPLGLETRVGDNGILFSGGQRQRLGLARAILRDVSLLLLDEATGALDEDNEREILENLRKSGIAVLIVTHRAPIRHVTDREIWIRDGHLIELATQDGRIENDYAAIAT
jgi:ABC-type bacteriocin/lantibiotic exporter with double-glycine peptidase domain